jgi:hypothetical protein
MTANKKVEVKESKTDRQRAEEFIKEYDGLCQKHQMNIVANPAFKARDDGTFSVVLQMSVGKLPKQD